MFKQARPFEVEGQKGEEGAGCVGLISSGRSPQESVFMTPTKAAARANTARRVQRAGNGVFFMTTAPLTSADFDKSYDVYDAHECTAASPCIPASPAAGAECVTAEACRAPPNPEPGIYGAPASATFAAGLGISPAPPPPAKAKASTKAPLLEKALLACKKKQKEKKHRGSVKRPARKRYVPLEKKAKKTSNGYLRTCSLI